MEVERRPTITALGKLKDVPDLPEHFVPRPGPLETLKRLLLTSTDKPIVVTGTIPETMTEGIRGIGKSVLLTALARDCEIRQTFRDGIYWIPVGQELCVSLLAAELATAMGAELPACVSLQQVVSHLKRLLSDKRCLFILDDVWNVRHGQAFDAVGGYSRLVAAARLARVANKLKATAFGLTALEDKEALTLLAAWAMQEVDSLPRDALDLACRCCNLPLALTLAGTLVREGMSWSAVLGSLDARHAEFANNPHAKTISALRGLADELDVAQKRYFMHLLLLLRH